MPVDVPDVAVTVTRPARIAVARPAGLTVSTLVSVLVHVALVTGRALPETTSVVVPPARRMGCVVVICSDPPDGEVGVDPLLSQPATSRARPARTVATRRDVTSRL